MECMGFFEVSCAGICQSELRLVPLYKECVLQEGSASDAILGAAVLKRA